MPAASFRLVPFEVSGVPAGDFAPALNIEITGTVELQAGTVSVTYHISGATERVKYSGVGAQPARQNELWRTTCFELFIKSTSATEYWEVNLAPSRAWNVYHFTAYRSELQPELRIADINIVTEVAQARLTHLRVAVPLPPPLAGHKLAIGISSVIEDTAGNLYYFALRHRGAKPDFHDQSCFDIILDPASA
jgi:hypothetical protein